MTDNAEKYVAAIDQGTTSSRCIVFNQDGAIVAVDQREHRQIFPKPGWVEHDATEIWSKVQAVVAGAIAKAGLRADQLSAMGITNQRETTLLWDRATGKPVHNAIVWQDTRTASLCNQLGGSDGQDRFREQTGLPLATYFSGPKAAWLLDNVPDLRARAERGEIAFGTMDSWLIWNLTGGTDGGQHVTDVTNAGRTMLMNLETLQWDSSILSAMNIPEAMLPEIKSSAEVYGTALGQLARRTRRLRAGRPAGGRVRPGLLRRRHGEEHVRHGKLPAAQHRQSSGAVEERSADHDGLQDRH